MNQTIEAMKKLANNKITIENCSGSTGNKSNLVRISILGQSEADSCMIMKTICAITKICDVADKHRFDLVIDLARYHSNSTVETLYKQIGFKYVNNRHEMIRTYNKQKFLFYRIEKLFSRAKE